MVTTFKKPVINNRPIFTPEEKQAFKERCKLVRLKSANRKGIMVNYLRNVLNTDSIKDYNDLRNICCGYTYRPDVLDHYEAYLDEVLEKENQKNHEPII